MNLLVFCEKCENVIGEESYDAHSNHCISKNTKTIIKKDRKHENNIYDGMNLSDIQVAALKWCSLKAKIFHNNVYQNAMIKFLDMGYNENDLINTLDYIKNLDAIVHFGRCSNNRPIEWLKIDTHLKNTFEVHNKCDSARVEWEDNLFHKVYKSDCSPKERVKYGCLNLLSDNAGCQSAHGYGQSYMILKNDIKPRITFVCGDSCTKQQHICTFDHCVQLLLYLDPITLKNVITLASMKKSQTANLNDLQKINRHYNYVEMQIHGDVMLTRDISHIMLYEMQVDRAIIDRLKYLRIPYTIFSSKDIKPYKPML